MQAQLLGDLPPRYEMPLQAQNVLGCHSRVCAKKASEQVSNSKPPFINYSSDKDHFPDGPTLKENFVGGQMRG